MSGESDATTQYINDGGNVIAEITGEKTQTYIRGKRLIAMQDEDGAWSIFGNNYRGDVERVQRGSYSNGRYNNRYAYDAFGNYSEETDSPKKNPFRYCGEYTDDETGLIYLRNRYYDPAIGRFITEDPAKDGLNWYAYTNNNPLKYADPTGLSSEERLGEGIWSFKSDEFGISILSHWLFGGGADYIQENGMWGSYMKDNSLLKTQVQEIVLPLANDVKKNSSKTIDITTSMEIQNGEDIIGYQYLHGTNADVGGFQIKGTVSKNKKGDITYDLTYTWNDKIDPNFMYDSDSKKAEFAKSIPLANPTDYTIRITWKDKTVIRANPKWYNRNTGWLR